MAPPLAARPSHGRLDYSLETELEPEEPERGDEEGVEEVIPAAPVPKAAPRPHA